MFLVALTFGEVAAFAPLATVLGFAALLLKRWWSQQDQAMSAAIEASNREGVKCDERITRLRERHDRDLAEVRQDLERVQMAVRELIPLVPPETQVMLWDLMWTRDDSTDAASRSTPAP